VDGVFYHAVNSIKCKKGSDQVEHLDVLKILHKLASSRQQTKDKRW
jgi:hypothetical protein